MLTLEVLPGALAVCRMPAGSQAPEWLEVSSFASVTRSEHETSIVCEAELVPGDVVADTDWRAVRVRGPLDFGLTGVLLSIAEPLARAGVPIFAVSTYDTDYVLVKAQTLERALSALSSAGHTIVPDGPHPRRPDGGSHG